MADHKCKLKQRRCHSEAAFCRRICAAKAGILRILPLRMTISILKFTLMNGRRVFIYAKTNNKRIVGHGHHQATSAAAPLKVLIDDDAIGQP